VEFVAVFHHEDVVAIHALDFLGGSNVFSFSLR